jgi:hypothetical protein
MRGRKGIGERRGRETYREKRKNKRKGNFERCPGKITEWKKE